MAESMILDGKKVANEIYDKLKVNIKNKHLKRNMKLVNITNKEEKTKKKKNKTKIRK